MRIPTSVAQAVLTGRRYWLRSAKLAQRICLAE